MKEKFFLVVVLTFLTTNLVQSQCAMGIQFTYTFDTSTLTVGSRTEMICCLWGNEYMSISNIVSGNTYTFDSCGASTDTEITLFDPNNNTVAFDSNSCTTSDDGQITSFLANMSGTYKIQINQAGCSAVSSNTQIFITLDTTLSLQELDFNSIASLYPNSANNSFSIETNQVINEVAIHDVHGKIVASFKETFSLFNIEELTPGIYFVKIKTDKGTTTKN